jgi:hypothetical protein
LSKTYPLNCSKLPPGSIGPLGGRGRDGGGGAMEYRGIEYRVVQGLEKNTWLWTVLSEKAKPKSGKRRLRAAAIAAAEESIDLLVDPRAARLKARMAVAASAQRSTFSGLRVGDRCVLSEMGRSRYARMAGTSGTVVGICEWTPVLVLFDTRSTSAVLPATYIEAPDREKLSVEGRNVQSHSSGYA